MRCNAVALLPFALVLGCVAPTDPFAGIDVAVTVTPPIVGLTGPANVTIAVTNNTRRPFLLPTYLCPVPFQVTTVTGIVVGPPAQICPMVIQPARDLAPGERFAFNVSWDGRGQNGSLPNGEYRIRGTPLGNDGPHGLPVSVTVEN